jgi:hypothetical protein
MTYLEIFALRFNSNDLKNRVAVAASIAANDITNEDPETANHAARLVWANATLANAQAVAEQAMWGICHNATIQTSGDASTDADIQFAFNGLIPNLMVV